MNQRQARGGLIVSMAVFGTIGVFVRHIPLPSGVIAAVRGLTGCGFLTLFAMLRRRPVSLSSLGRALPLLLLSGTLLGLNWILLFEAFRYTTVASATICYYLAPVLVVLASPLLLGERLTRRRLLCAAAAFGGMLLLTGTDSDGTGWKGIALALGAACLYAGLTLLNKRISGPSAFDRTAVQLGVAGVVLLPYCALSASGVRAALPPGVVVLLAVVGIVHTGLTYLLFFGSMERLSAQSVSILSYLDPVVAVLCSALVLGEPLTLPGVLGSALVLGAAVVSELPQRGLAP